MKLTPEQIAFFETFGYLVIRQLFDADEMAETARSIGFTNISYEYDWYLGQASVMHGQSLDASNIVEAYLRMALPSTRALFKYIRLVFKK